MIASALLLACAPRMPSAQVEGMSLTELGLHEASATVQVAVDNPLLVAIPVEGFRWSLEVDGHPVGQGTHDAPLTIEANAVSVVRVPVRVRYADLAKAVGTDAETVPYRVALELDVATPRGPVTLPIAHEGTLPQLRAPTVDLVDVRMGLDEGRPRVEVDLALGLPAGAALEQLQWTLAVDDAPVGHGTARVHEDGTLTLPMILESRQAAASTMALVLGQAERFTLALTGALNTPLGVVPIDLGPFVLAGSQQGGLAEPGVPRSPAP